MSPSTPGSNSSGSGSNSSGSGSSSSGSGSSSSGLGSSSSGLGSSSSGLGSDASDSDAPAPGPASNPDPNSDPTPGPTPDSGPDPLPDLARIVIVENHQMVRMVMGSYLEGQEDMDLVDEHASAEAALERLPGAEVDLVLLDLSLGEMSGLDLIDHLQSGLPDLPVLVLTGQTSPTYARKVVRAGARGYIVKEEMKHVPAGIRAVLRGETYLSPAVRDARDPR